MGLVPLPSESLLVVWLLKVRRCEHANPEICCQRQSFLPVSTSQVLSTRTAPLLHGAFGIFQMFCLKTPKKKKLKMNKSYATQKILGVGEPLVSFQSHKTKRPHLHPVSACFPLKAPMWRLFASFNSATSCSIIINSTLSVYCISPQPQVFRCFRPTDRVVPSRCIRP